MFAPGIPSGSRLREPRGRAPRARRASGRPPRQGGRCLTGARSGDRGATFPEPRRRWPPAPGRAGAAPGRSSRNKVTGPAVAGRGRLGGAGAPARRGPADRTRSASASFSGERAPGRLAASSLPGGAAARLAPHSPASASRAPLQQRGRPAAGGRRSRRSEPLAHKVVESPGLRGGERPAAARRGLSPAEGRGGASGSRSLLGNHREPCPPFLWIISADGKL